LVKTSWWAAKITSSTIKIALAFEKVSAGTRLGTAGLEETELCSFLLVVKKLLEDATIIIPNLITKLTYWYVMVYFDNLKVVFMFGLLKSNGIRLSRIQNY
jgi:hypothetical protein